MNIFKGEILLESLAHELPQEVLVENIEELHDQDGIWHVYHVSVKESQLSTMSSLLKDGPWFLHFWNNEEMVVIFKDVSFRFVHGDMEVIGKIKEHAKTLHIPESELQF